MPGYYIHLASCNTEALSNRRFVLGVEAPDLLKKYYKTYGEVEKVFAKYESLLLYRFPDLIRLKQRILQKEKSGCTDGLHYGLSSTPNVIAFWCSLNKNEKIDPFWRGYAWHLLTDAIMYGRLNIDDKFRKALEINKDAPNIEQLKIIEVNRLHEDWDRTNAKVRNTYPEVTLPKEIEELSIVKFIEEGDLVYVDWHIVKSTIEYLRSFDQMYGNMDSIIVEVLNNI